MAKYITVEEECRQGGRVCNCPVNHFGYFDSISSTKSFIEKTNFLTKAFGEGGENADDVIRRDEESKEEGKTRLPLEKNWKYLEEYAQSERACQKKGGSSFSNKAMREQVLSDDGASCHSRSIQLVHLFKNSKVNLTEGVHLFKAITARPEISEVQFSSTGDQNKKTETPSPKNQRVRGSEEEGH